MKRNKLMKQNKIMKTKLIQINNGKETEKEKKQIKIKDAVVFCTIPSSIPRFTSLMEYTYDNCVIYDLLVFNQQTLLAHFLLLSSTLSLLSLPSVAVAVVVVVIVAVIVISAAIVLHYNTLFAATVAIILIVTINVFSSFIFLFFFSNYSVS